MYIGLRIIYTHFPEIWKSRYQVRYKMIMAQVIYDVAIESRHDMVFQTTHVVRPCGAVTAGWSMSSSSGEGVICWFKQIMLSSQVCCDCRLIVYVFTLLRRHDIIVQTCCSAIWRCDCRSVRYLGSNNSCCTAMWRCDCRLVYAFTLLRRRDMRVQTNHVVQLCGIEIAD